MKKITILIILLFLFTNSFAQDSLSVSCSNSSFGIPSSEFGIGFGNSKKFTGLRLNLGDCGIESINGINITLWKPGKNYNGEINGISLGIAPNANVLRGINFGLAGVIAHSEIFGFSFSGIGLVSEGSISGISIAGLGLVSEGTISGINFSGLGLVSQEGTTGINVAGLGLVSEGNITGINVGGLACVGNEITGLSIGTLALVGQKDITGINFGGLALVAEKDLTGLNFSLLANVSNGEMTGLNFSGLALVGQEGISGFNFGGAAIVSEDASIKGINISVGAIKTFEELGYLSFVGYKIEAEKAVGLNIAGIWNDIDFMSGICIGGYNRVNSEQNGISIGLLNVAKVLNGVQIGLINIAKNNPAPFKVLPIINANL